MNRREMVRTRIRRRVPGVENNKMCKRPGLVSLGAIYGNTEAIELLCQVDTLALDRTGTLTEGTSKLATADSDEILALVAVMERGLTIPRPYQNRSNPGKGVRRVLGKDDGHV